jgi:hypothetical protein
MAKSARRRALPSSPQKPTPVDSPASPPSGPDASEAGMDGADPGAEQAPRVERPHVIEGTGCVGGHPRGQELNAGRLGQVPSNRQAWTGFALLCWCFGGLLFLAEGKWAPLAFQVAVVWLVFAAIVVRSAGHRGRCWRTRTWRHAWGGLTPGSGADPTRPAGT